MNKRNKMLIGFTCVLNSVLLNVVLAESTDYQKTCGDIAAEWNVYDWATISKKLNMSVENLEKAGVRPPSLVTPEGCSLRVAEKGWLWPHFNGKPITKESCSKEMLSPKMEFAGRHTIRKVQMKLRNLGYEPGPLDGIWGKKKVGFNTISN